jgi:hypothetical protein
MATDWKTPRIFLWWAVLVAASFALIQGAGAMQVWAIATIATLGAGAGILACLEHAWLRTPKALFGIPIAGLMIFLAWKAWPKPDLPKVTPIIKWLPSPIMEGQPLSADQLNAQAFVDGVPVNGVAIYEPAIGSTLTAGGRTLKVSFTFPDRPKLLPVEDARTIQVMAPARLEPSKPEEPDSLKQKVSTLAHQMIAYEFVREENRDREETQASTPIPGETGLAAYARMGRAVAQDRLSYAAIDTQFDTTFGRQIQDIVSELGQRKHIESDKLWDLYQAHNHYALGFALENISSENAVHGLNPDQESLFIRKLRKANLSDPRLGWKSELDVYSSPQSECRKLGEQLVKAAASAGWETSTEVLPLPIDKAGTHGIAEEGILDGTAAMVDYAFHLMGIPIVHTEKNVGVVGVLIQQVIPLLTTYTCPVQ